MHQFKERQQLANLHLNAGGAVVVSSHEPDFSQHSEPSGSKQFLVFGGGLGLLIAGAIAGYLGTNAVNQKALQEAETKAVIANFKLHRNQSQIDDFCRINSSFGGKQNGK